MAATATDVKVLADEPLLFRMERVSATLYKQLNDQQDKQLLELITRVANTSPTNAVATKRELKGYRQPGNEKSTRDVLIKYRTRERQILQTGTHDIPWGLKWLFSFIILVDTPVKGAARVDRMLELTKQWLQAMAEDGIYEVGDQLSELNALLDSIGNELNGCRELTTQLPGPFNTACNLLFGDRIQDAAARGEIPRWAIADQQSLPPLYINRDENNKDMRMAMSQAREYVDGVVGENERCTNSQARDLRVESISPSFTRGAITGCTVTVQPIDRGSMEPVSSSAPVDLWLEVDIAANLHVGIVIEATLHFLSSGQAYVHEVTMVWPSFTPMDYMDIY